MESKKGWLKEPFKWNLYPKEPKYHDYIELKIWSYRTFRVALATFANGGDNMESTHLNKGKTKYPTCSKGIYNILNFFLNN